MGRLHQRDKTLIEHLTGKIGEWDEAAGRQTVFSEMLKACDAYIATGSNNSSAILNIILQSTRISSAAT
jgi:hypothetical protein